MKLVTPRYMYDKEGQAVYVVDPLKVDGLFIKPPHKWAKDEKPFGFKVKEVKKSKEK